MRHLADREHTAALTVCRRCSDFAELVYFGGAVSAPGDGEHAGRGFLELTGYGQ